MLDDVEDEVVAPAKAPDGECQQRQVSQRDDGTEQQPAR